MDRYTAWTRQKPCRAFSLIELTIAVAVIAIVGGIAALVISQYQSAVREQKLRTDVKTLNNAAKAFLTSGGILSDAETHDAALARLKTSATAATFDEVVGLKGGFIDARIAAIPMTPDEEAGSKLRSRWNASSLRFELVTSGPGIKEFALGDAAGDSEHQRQTPLKFSKNGTWIWDYTDRGGSRPAPPSDGTLLSPDIAPPAAGSRDSPTTLSEPSLSLSGGVYSLSEFPLEVAVISAAGNPADAVDYYSVDNGSTWSVYTEPIVVHPSVTVAAYTASSDPDFYIDSEHVIEEFYTEKVELEFALVTDKTSYTYAELGGALMLGSPPPPPQAEPAEVQLTNSGAIPLEYQNSETFEVRFSYDGTDPLIETGFIKGESFDGGFPGQVIPLSLAIFGSSESLELKAAGKSFNTSVLTDSSVETVTVSAQTVVLPPPVITVDEVSGEVSITMDLESGKIPEGAYIYYSLDGTDPGDDGSGEPLEGELYSNPFTPEADVQIIARCYAPPAHLNWFEMSSPELKTLVLPKYDVYIGGDFYLDGTAKTHRNVARLASDGLVDPEFNPGSGANAGSIVGAVLRQGGNGVLVSGDFQTISGVAIPALVRLDETGAIDSGFDAALE